MRETGEIERKSTLVHKYPLSNPIFTCCLTISTGAKFYYWLGLGFMIQLMILILIQLILILSNVSQPIRGNNFPCKNDIHGYIYSRGGGSGKSGYRKN